MKIGIVGACGRMGRSVISEILLDKNLQLSGAVTRPDSDAMGVDVGILTGFDKTGIVISENSTDLFAQSDAVIDFTSPASSVDYSRLAAKNNTVHVVGTTGFSKQNMEALKIASEKTQIVCAPNMSLGVNLLMALTEQVSSLLDQNFDIEITESHHRNKIDSPSGTAIGLGNSAAKGRGVNLDDVATWSRKGQMPKREDGEIGFSVIRGGDVIGDHTVSFMGMGERLELTHKAQDRTIYAKGAIYSAIWAAKQPVGLYSMKDVLGF